MTAKMFIRSQIMPRYSGVFVSMNREEARTKIDYADELYDSLPTRWKTKRVARSKDEIAFVDKAGRRSTLRSLAGKAPRGRGGDVGISELPHCISSKSIYEGALHVTARSENDHLTVESTPLGERGVFHDLSTGRYPEFLRYEVPWWLSSALCNDIETATRMAPAMPTGDRVEKFGAKALQSIYASMPEPAFRQESELEFIDLESTAFPVEMIIECAQKDFSDVAPSSLLHRSVERVPTALDWAWLSQHRHGALVAGYDPARKNDRSALAIFDIAGGQTELRMMVSMHNAPFAVQRDVIKSAINSGVTALRIDSTGIGMDMAERLNRDYPDIVEGIHFTSRSKQMR